jgi:dolichyl-phosphate beta-glucosyltransferase
LPKISIVIPAYNEQARLPATISSVCNFFTIKEPDFEIVIVSDGSNDHTVDVVNECIKKHPQIRLISYPINKGKGFAAKTGVLSAQGDLILMSDADSSSPIEEFDRLNSAIANGAQLAIGSRAKPDPNCKVKALPYRTYIGNTFNRIVQSLLLPGIYDTQCGFKLFRKDVAHDIFSSSQVDGYAFDVEILYIAREKRYRLEEVSINWNNCSGSKVNIWVDSVKMLVEVLKIFLRAIQGKYSQHSLKQTDE